MDNIFPILGAILGFALVIFIHEAGHFLLAKALGFKVEEFAIGFGTPLIRKKYKDTFYSLRLIPWGGYNKLPEIDSSYVKSPMSFNLYIRRFCVLAAGGIFNILSAFFVILFAILVFGVPEPSQTIHSIHPEISQAASNFQEGDKLLAINGETLDNPKEMASKIAGVSEASFLVERQGEDIVIPIEKQVGTPIGVQFETVQKQLPTEEAVPAATKAFGATFISMYHAFQLMTQMNANEITSSVSGPIGVSVMMYGMSKDFGMVGFCVLFALLSVNIGLLNLLPIPLLDGGRIAIDTIQYVTRNLLPEKGIKYLEYGGLAFIIGLFALGLTGDLKRILGYVPWQ